MQIKTGLNIVNDQKSSELHQQHFGDPSATDTMSFPINQPNPDGDYFLGDIVVNYDQLKRQASELDISEKEELARLITHSALHLLGFEDETEAGSEQMRQSENTVMSKLFKRFTHR